ncbi:MAG: N-acetylneuraminate synthase family protein [Candidatus Anammoxibacter sp.]
MKINNKEIKTGDAYIIADVGSNYRGSPELAKEYIQKCKEIGVDAVKFQSYRAESLLNPTKPDGDNWEAYDIVKKYELPVKWHQELFEYAEKVGVEFFTTPFNLDIIDELDNIGIRAFKVASGDLTFFPLLEKIAALGKTIILSTGMAYIEEVKDAVDVLKRNGTDDIALLHCVSNYPPAYEHVNLQAIKTMSNLFKLPVGLSDHTSDDVTAIGAIALGASIIEKHITFDKEMGTPDAAFAMTIDEFAIMIKKIRNLERAIGDGIKRPTDDEVSERQWARRGIYAKRDIKKDEELTLQNVKFVRPINGLGASEWLSCCGKKLNKSASKDMPLRKEDIGK